MTVQAAKKLCAASGRRCLPLCLDVRRPESIAAAVDETLKELGRIDILVNSTSPLSDQAKIHLDFCC